MIKSLKVRLWIIFAVFVWAAVWITPNFVNFDNKWWVTKGKMTLGLDIQGGSHLVLRVDVEGAVKQLVIRTAKAIEEEMKKEGVALTSVTPTDFTRGMIEIKMPMAQIDKLSTYVDTQMRGEVVISDKSADGVILSFSEARLRTFEGELVDQAIEKIRNRIDEFGVSEPSITKQGADRILVQLPGIKDSSGAKDLINRTAKLEFIIVSTEMQGDALMKLIDDAQKANNLDLKKMKYSAYVEQINAALKDKLPKDTVVYFGKPDGAANLEDAPIPYLLKTSELVPGDSLTDARVAFDNMSQSPIVEFQFNADGARLFGEMTTRNTSQLMAIVLDKVVKSAPQINTPITGGRGQITLGRGRDYNKTMSEAKFLSVSLRAGALPAALEQLEERTVGPSLGADAIAKGQMAALIGTGLVFLFMIVFYSGFGLIASISLVFNAMIVLAVMSALGATLTLPGVAGLALTIGIAVDTNVIIYERIKEELSKGATFLGAISEGYHRAFSSILDANITSVSVCVVLMIFGTGPVRGFAVTLLAGLVIQTFTGVFFTRALIDLMVTKWKWNLKVKWS